MKRLVGLVGIIGLFVLVGFTQPVLADELSDLKRELEGLQERVQELEAIDATEQEHTESAMGPTLSLNGFADFSFTAEDTDSGDSNTFALGQFDLFITSRISDNISFLSETVFEFDDDNEAVLDLERVELKYAFTEWLAVKIGRMHTSFGFWNTAYHHSTWLHTSANRPIFFNWEDENGIIPSHVVGINLSGKFTLRPFKLLYVLEVGNGRGADVEEIQNISDKNDAKAVNLLIGVKPDFIPGLEVGFNIYNDDIPADDSTEGIAAGRDGEIDELILTGYFAYFNNGIELIGELSNINHDDEVSNKDYDTLGFYLQGSYQIDSLTPYYRFERVDFGNGDPYYTPDDIDIIKHSIGLRWDVNTWHALKLQYSYIDREDPGDNSHAVIVNASFRF